MQNQIAATSSNYPAPVQFPAREVALSVPNPLRDIDAKANLVLSRLPEGAPFVRICHVAPLLGLTDSGLRKYCPHVNALKNWRGDYRFHLDDREHMAALRALVKVVLWSGRKLPEELQTSPAAACKYLH